MSHPTFDRRTVLSAAAAAGFAAALDEASAAPGPKPNILWLVSEDNNPFIGAYGDKLAHTPTIDALAKKGVLYRKAYSNAPVCAPSRFAIITGAYPESAAPANQMRAIAKIPRGWQATPQFLRRVGYYCTNNEKTDYNCEIDPAQAWDESSAEAHWRKRPAGAPFFAVFNHMVTHESRLFQPQEGRVKPQDVVLPSYLPDTPAIRQDVATYYNVMEIMDGQLATRLAELEADGVADDTIVFYYSDNGGTLPTSKRYCHEQGLRCGLVVYVPEKWAHLAPGKPGTVVESPVTHIDLPPTVLAIAGVPQPPQMAGRPLFASKAAKPQAYAFGMRNRMDEVYDFVRTVSDGRFRYIRNYLPHLPQGRYGAFQWQAKGYQSLETELLAGRLTPVQRRFFEPRPYEELYDVEADPDQVNNLAGEAGSRAKLAELRRALDAHMIAVNDNGFIPEGSPLEGYEASRAPGAYPLKRVMALAEAAGQRDVSNLPAFVKGLSDPNEVIRYWSAQGIIILGPQGAGAAEALEARLAAEPSPQVRVALAEALSQGRPEAGVEVLTRLLDTEPSSKVKLQALNALTNLGPAAKPALPLIERLRDTSRHTYVKSRSTYLALKLSGKYQPTTKVFDMAWFRLTEAER
ncbi:sulfatase-like hydrolase/transferase [Phenylobacterium deserti]|uniref:Sulfatase n=1 Tax=Phenylobacterium deserti TaxID=1914756 RepID=A0A328A9U3_9CAUL|nr:sulfatase-like hydrolase/transferase [Phenylobacterium deserti]RAK51432.1 sulfatase [Phenylobacterium deserti]